MSYLGILTVAIALAEFIPACDTSLLQKFSTGAFTAAGLRNRGAAGRQLRECPNGEYLNFNCTSGANDTVATVLFNLYEQYDMCKSTPRLKLDITVATFSTISNGETKLNGCNVVGGMTNPVYATYMCTSGVLAYRFYNDMECKNLVMSSENLNEIVAPGGCGCSGEGGRDAQCSDSCGWIYTRGYPTNCTDLGKMLSADGCLETCLGSDLPNVRQDLKIAFILGVAPDLLICTSEIASLALKVNSTATGAGTWHMAIMPALEVNSSATGAGTWHMAIMPALPLLFALGY
mmetsp:Transcript_1108/g.1954  ORF Transcript_1108/g.1954 Transcript_1108/m.1954 type:complete len:290 (+) Transcript_1108:55-924(+)